VGKEMEYEMKELDRTKKIRTRYKYKELKKMKVANS